MQIDAEMVEKMKEDDLITALCKEFGEDYPELMGPLLHDRCVLGGCL